MGDSRSLRRLHEAYTGNNPESCPAIDTLKLWSRKHGWREKAANYDVEVCQQTIAYLAAEEGRSRAILSREFWQLTHQALRRIHQALENEMKGPHSIKDLRELVTIAVHASNQAVDLMDRASAR